MNTEKIETTENKKDETKTTHYGCNQNTMLMLKKVIPFVVLILTFCLGFKMGELKGMLHANGYRGGHSMMNRDGYRGESRMRPMMQPAAIDVGAGATPAAAIPLQ
jgi:hypothetical protein